MNRIYIRDLGGADYRWNIQVALRQLRRTNTNRLVGETHVQRISVCLAIDGDRADTQFFARANDTQCNLAAIRYQNFLEHNLKNYQPASSVERTNRSHSMGIP
jgi:hypothetical protein